MILPDTFFGRHWRHMAILNVGARASSPYLQHMPLFYSFSALLSCVGRIVSSFGGQAKIAAELLLGSEGKGRFGGGPGQGGRQGGFKVGIMREGRGSQVPS